MPARLGNIILGAWLFLSAFLWPHTPAQMTNTWVLGALCMAFALVGLVLPAARYLNTALSLWLFASAFVLPTRSAATVWNNALVAIAIFLVSLVPGEGLAGVRRPARETG